MGQLTPVAVAIAMALLQIVVTCFAIFAALALSGVGDARGAAAFSVAVGAVAVFFIGLSTIAAQLADSARGAIGLTAAVLGGAYLLRGLADVRADELTPLTPFGWAQGVAAWADDAWWLALVPLGVGLVLAAVGAWLSMRRDLGVGMLPKRPGRERASQQLVSPAGMAFRLERTNLVGWAVAMIIFGLVYGPVLTEADRFLAQMPQLEEMLPDGAAAGGVRVFASIIVGLSALLCTIPALQAVTRLASDERRGRTPLLLSAVSRTRWLLANATVAVVAGAVPLLAFGICFGAIGATVQDDGALFAEVVGAALAYVPAQVVAVGFGLLLAGWVPRLTAFVWAIPLHGISVFFFAELLDWPAWISRPSAFSHVPAGPAVTGDAPALAGLLALGLALVAAGAIGYRRRAIG